MKRPRPLMLVALSATVVMSGVALLGDGGTEVVQPVARATAAVPSAPPSQARRRQTLSSTDVSLSLAPRPKPQEQARDLFAAYSWLPPPPPPPPPAPPAPPPPPPPPEAPPLPVKFVGEFQIDGQPSFLLIDGEHTYRVPIGGQVGEFRLQSAAPRQLVFVHVPTGLPRTLEISGLPLALGR